MPCSHYGDSDEDAMGKERGHDGGPKMAPRRIMKPPLRLEGRRNEGSAIVQQVLEEVANNLFRMQSTDTG